MEVNEHILKITGSATLAGPLQQDHEYAIAVICTVSGINGKSNHDGTENKIYSAEQSGLAEIVNSSGQKKYTKGKKSLSSKLRGALWHYHSENDMDMEFENFYKSMMTGMIGQADKIIKLILKEQNHEELDR